MLVYFILVFDICHPVKEERSSIVLFYESEMYFFCKCLGSNTRKDIKTHINIHAFQICCERFENCIQYKENVSGDFYVSVFIYFVLYSYYLK